MDDERDVDSQVSSSAPSLSWWMMRSLWQQGVSEERHLRVSVADTFLLEDGHLICWYFTSTKTGHVLKRANKRCEWDELLRFLSRRVKSTWGTGRDQWTPRVVAIARRLRGGQTSAIVLTESDIKFLREKHNVHLLDEIVAIQPHITRISFSGCGLFETTFRRKGRFREAQVAYATYELARWPEDDRSPPQDYQEIADYSEMIPSEYGRVARSAICHVPQRVHGVLHRVLATTTKEIVTHVERETSEVLLGFVAQYVFPPGSGQPTLIWLDSVTTLRCARGERHEMDGKDIEKGGTEDGTLAELTRNWCEVDSPWTTYFPAKFGDLGGAGGSTEEGFSSFETRGNVGLSRWRSKGGDSSGNLRVLDKTSPMASGHGQYTDQKAPQSVADDVANTQCEEPCCDPFNSGKYGARSGHFTLPTESWANRSAGLRGLYFNRGGTGVCANLSGCDEWPRKRSTGTAMRIGELRPDLRRASENARPATAPARITEAMKQGMRGTASLPMDAISRRLPGRASGCYGDYCQYAHSQSSESRRRAEEQGVCGNGCPPSKLVPYKSILKSRAEEKALALRAETGLPAGHVLPQHGDESEDEYQTLPKSDLASAVAERMRLLALYLNDDGRAEYARLRSSDRRRAGAPEAAQRAVEELLYEEALSHIHPTTMCRPVTVCDNCAMVYGYMDLYRKEAKRLKQLSRETSRSALIAWRREQLTSRGTGGEGVLFRPSTAPAPDRCSLRRYSTLNLTAGIPAKEQVSPSDFGARPATTDGIMRPVGKPPCRGPGYNSTGGPQTPQTRSVKGPTGKLKRS